MSTEWQWLIPVLTWVMGAWGGYMGASRKVMVLETNLNALLTWKTAADRHLTEHNEDILVHDIEIQALCLKTGVPRARRQMLRDD